MCWCLLFFSAGQFFFVLSFCVQTAAISYDYLTAFKHVQRDTEQYFELRSKVDTLCFLNAPKELFEFPRVASVLPMKNILWQCVSDDHRCDDDALVKTEGLIC